MHIKSLYTAIKKAHLTIYKQIHYFKYVRKGVIKDYSENIKSSISGLQNNSSAVIESRIKCSSKSITS